MSRPPAAEHRVKRTTVDLDLDALEQARDSLGTRTTRDTVNTALREVGRRAALVRAAALIEQGGLGIPDPDELRALRRARSLDG
jgi:Arc/MetJ family transcription regulator